MRAITKTAIEWAKTRAEKGEPLDAERTLEFVESHENLREAYEDALRRATGHAYASGMAEAGEDIQAQELARERADHAETRGLVRRYEGVLHDVRDALNFHNAIGEAEQILDNLLGPRASPTSGKDPSDG